jgi:hypothetical protein
LKILAEMRSGLDAVKSLRKYAEAQVTAIFDRIGGNAVENWRCLYPETSTGLKPGRLALGKGRDKSVESLLSANDFDVPSEHFGNAGLRRAIALAFYFALLEEHPGGLGFVIMDDPVLSLDDEHRDTWSHELLLPKMENFQFLVATHQRQYLNLCRNDFKKGETFELIPRERLGKVAWRPGNRLDRAEQELKRAPTNAPNEMRKYREDLFAALQLYNPTATQLDTDTYAGLQPPHPLSGNNRDKIVKTLRDPAVIYVLDPGSHGRTEADVTEPMAKKCLLKMREIHQTIINEFDRLDKLSHRSKSTLQIIAPVTGFNGVMAPQPPASAQQARLIGHAAARSDNCVIDDEIEPLTLRVTASTGVLVSSNSLDPVAKHGEWVLLADVSITPHDGDLVIAEDNASNRYLRRAWSDGDRWILNAINPVHDIPAVAIPKNATIQKVIGVLHDPYRQPSITKYSISEWQPRADFDSGWLDDLSLVRIEGDSLNPIARRGQYVILDTRAALKNAEISAGILAAVDTLDSSIGHVIKYVFRNGKQWVLTSRNPVEVIAPLIVHAENIRKVWPVRGILFEGAVNEVD